MKIQYNTKIQLYKNTIHHYALVSGYLTDLYILYSFNMKQLTIRNTIMKTR